GVLRSLEGQLHQTPGGLAGSDDRAGLIEGLPSVGEDHLDAEIGMIEAIRDEVSGAWIVSVHEPLDVRAVARRVDAQVPAPAGHRGLGELAGADLAVAGIRVRGEKTGKLRSLALADPVQDRVGFGDHAWVDVVLG